MADFITSQNIVKKLEGGYQKMYNDPGNWTSGVVGSGVLVGTNWGISAPAMSRYLGRTATEADMRNMNYLTAVSIYKKDYWDPLYADTIKNQSIATLVYDTTVNMGIDDASRFTRIALNNQGNNFDINKRYFNTTITDAINKSDENKLFSDIWNQRNDWYEKSNSEFEEGWQNRLKRIVYSPTVIGLGAVVFFSGYFY